MKILTNDTIKVLTGDDKGKTGKVLKSYPQELKVLVEGVGAYKKHRKAMGDQEGGIVTLFRPINVANVALVCPNCNKETRVGYQGEGKDKVRVCKKCLKPIITEKPKK